MKTVVRGLEGEHEGRGDPGLAANRRQMGAGADVRKGQPRVAALEPGAAAGGRRAHRAVLAVSFTWNRCQVRFVEIRLAGR